MTKPDVVMTCYRMNLDRSTIDMLKGAAFEWPNAVVPGALTGKGLEYAVAYAQDNEYVHKAVHRSVRNAIRIAKHEAAK